MSSLIEFVINHLKTELTSIDAAYWGSPARVYFNDDAKQLISSNGIQSPSLAVFYEGSSYERTTTGGSPYQEMIGTEQITIFAFLDGGNVDGSDKGETSQYGNKEAFKVRDDLWAALVGWNPSLGANPDDNVYKQFYFAGDGFNSRENNVYIHDYTFTVDRDLNNNNHGFGADRPNRASTLPHLDQINTDYNLKEAEPDTHPNLEGRVNL